MIAPVDKLFLKRWSLGFGIKKFLLVTDLRLVIVSSYALRIWNKFIRYEGAILLATLYMIFALFKNTISSNESIFNLSTANKPLNA